MGHLGQIGHDRVADDVLAQTHGQHGFGIVVGVGAQNLGQPNRLAFGIGQFKRHVIFAWDGLHNPDRHQTERARQILGQADNL